MIIQDRGDVGFKAMEGAAFGFIGQAGQTPGLANVFTLYNAATPRVYADIDRTKADMLGVAAGARCSRRCRSISARPTSTTSTCSAAPTA